MALVEAAAVIWVHEQVPWPLWTAFVGALVAAWYAGMKVMGW